MADSSEEKKHQPTPIKLRRLRRDGQVARSRDITTLAILPVLLWLVFGWRSFERGLRRIMAEAWAAGDVLDADVIVSKIVPGIAWQVTQFVVPVFLILAVLILLFSVVDAGGLIISAKPISPNFERLNPAAGLKRLFSARNGAETAISLVKLLAYGLVAFTLFWRSISTVREVQACGLKCAPAMFKDLIFPIIAFACVLYALAALVDFVVSRAMFRLEQKMTDTEMKRENKDTYGAPEVRRRRRDEGRNLSSGSMKIGISHATLVVLGREQLVGLRFVQGDTPAPVVVVKARGEMVQEIAQLARAGDIPILYRPTLATVLDQRGMVGQFVPKETFAEVASAIITAGQ